MRWIIALNIKAVTIKLPEANKGKYVHDLGKCDFLAHRIINHHRKKIDKLVFITIEHFYLLEDTNKKWTGKPHKENDSHTGEYVYYTCDCQKVCICKKEKCLIF